jgi:cytochrome b pre-mRNA-processing protein 3
MVLGWLKARKDAKTKAKALYFAAATQARTPSFYQGMGVPDSFDGRFEMTALHAFFLINALKNNTDKRATRLSQALFDHMFRVTDQAIREMGIGDLSVPRHMKRMMTAFNGRARTYAKAIDEGQDLKEALRRNVYGTVATPDENNVAALEAYVRHSIAAVNAADVLEGRANFITAVQEQGGEQRYG